MQTPSGCHRTTTTTTKNMLTRFIYFANGIVIVCVTIWLRLYADTHRELTNKP